MDKLLGTAKLAGEDSKPTIYAKASLSHEQIDVKNRIGCDGIEIQLLNELVADRENTFTETQKMPLILVNLLMRT